MSDAEIIAALISIPGTVALAHLLNKVFQIKSRWRPLVALGSAEFLALMATWITNGDFKLAVARGFLIGLMAAGFYSATKTMARS